MGSGLALAISQASHFLQPPPHQSIIIERMHSGMSWIMSVTSYLHPDEILILSCILTVWVLMYMLRCQHRHSDGVTVCVIEEQAV